MKKPFLILISLLIAFIFAWGIIINSFGYRWPGNKLLWSLFLFLGFIAGFYKTSKKDLWVFYAIAILGGNFIGALMFHFHRQKIPPNHAYLIYQQDWSRFFHSGGILLIAFLVFSSPGFLFYRKNYGR